MAKVIVTSAIVGKSGVTLYLETGDTVNLSKDSWEKSRIMDDITPKLAVNKSAKIDLDAYSAHKVVEENSGGLIRFVRRKVGALFGKSEKDKKMTAVINGKEVEGIENIDRQIEYAVLNNNTKGVENFIKRMSEIVEHRRHSVEDALDFMRQMDLPIADDGSIVAYKKLQSTNEEGVFVDCYTKRVRQSVGSFVTMPVELVDPNRRASCSNGLHIGGRGYMGQFSGDVIVIVKIEPEDVIAVPQYDSFKMRVAGYHIVGRITGDAYRNAIDNKSMTGDESAARLLGEIKAGNHRGRTEIVQIKADRAEEYEVRSLITDRTTLYRLNKESDVQQAAISGDMSAALTTSADEQIPMTSEGVALPGASATSLDDMPEVRRVDVRETRKRIEEERAKAKTKKTKKVKKTNAPADPAPGSSKIEQALDHVRKGGSQREAARLFRVCPKTLRKRLKTEN